jgi:signal transduction histidine kinase
VVNNQGRPIPPDKISCIFEPLVRVAANIHSDHAEQTSLGIGLYISREIVHAHGGQIGVTSDAEGGTTFTVTMPHRRKESRATNAAAGPD